MTTNGHSAESFNGSRTTPLYTVPEAAHLARVSSTTVRNWLYGTEDRETLFQAPRAPMVSFLQLIEIVVAANFRKSERVSLARVRTAYMNAREDLHLQFPFAYEQLEVVGGHIVRILHAQATTASYQAMDSPEQWTLPGLMRDTIDQIEYEQELAIRWFPIGKTVPIVVDPRLSTGLPVIQGRGVTVEAIRKRFKAGLRIEFIAKDFEMDTSLIETALQYWERVAA